jgi:predicted nucleic acid-binding protein
VIVLDANVLIAAFDGSDLHHEWAISFLRDTVSEELMISTLTYAEILVAPIRAERLKDFRKGIDSLGFSIDGIASADAPEIARLRAETGLKMPDVIVLHAALKHDASLATADAVLSRKAAALGIAVFSPTI